MAPHSLFLSALVGVAALGALPLPAAAQSRGYISISVGAPVPYYGGYGGGYGRYGYGGGYGGTVWVGGTWTHGYGGGYGYGGYGYPGYGYTSGYRRGYYNRGYNRGYYGRGYYGDGYRYGSGYRYRDGYGTRVIYAPTYPPPLPGGFYYQRGGYNYPPVYYDHYRTRRGW